MKNLLRSRRARIIAAIVVGIAVIGAGYLVISTVAAGFFAAQEGEQGTPTGNASIINDTVASGGKAVQFNAPTTPPPPTGQCVAGRHVAGGADPWGGCWPGPDNTGVPAGVTLTPYTGSCTIRTAGTVIDKKEINCRIVIQAANVTIKNSKINGVIDVDGSSYSATIEDSEVHAGSNTAPAIGFENITVRRADITGSQHSITCGNNCIVEDSWLHNQFAQGESHNNAILSNGGKNIRATHNSLYCEPEDNDQGGGCTGDMSLFGDFSPIVDVVADKNLFFATPGGYCFSGGYGTSKPYGMGASNIKVTNNIFKRGRTGICAVWGPATSYTTAGGGVWSNNTWEDGGVVNP